VNAPPPAYGPPPTRAPKKNSGCLIALAIVAGILVLGGIAVAIGVYAFMRSDSGKLVAGAIHSGVQIAAEAQNAPGTAELRAMGCDTAMVMDMAKLEAMGSAFADASARAPTSSIRIAVVCQSRRAAPPTCDQVATTYVQAIGRASGKFSAQVQSSAGTRSCSGIYSPEGTRAE
jgi:hypothetical protein